MSSPQTVSFSGKIKIKGFSIHSSQQVQAKNYSINCHLTRQIIQHAPNIFIPRTVKFTNNLVSLTDFSIENTEQSLTQTQNKQYAICVGKQNQTDFHTVLGKKYQCLLSKAKQFSLKLSLQHTPSFALTFDLVDRPKFAKTLKLQNLLSGNDSQGSGIITMDQSGRFLVQSISCEFPAVGIWVRCHDLNEIGVYMRITHFLTKKVGKIFKKFVLGWEKKTCIAFVKINDNEVPELYFVSWKQINLSQPFQKITNEYQMGQNKEIILNFSKVNLEFTLRGASSGDEVKQIGYTSPKKDLTKEQLQQQLQKIHLQESPQFSSIKKHHWLEQRTFLLDKVQNQECQIKKLRRQIEKLTNEIKKIKNFNSPSEKPLQHFRSPSLLGSASAGNENFKKLSSNDLQISNQNSNLNLNGKIFESGSTKQKSSSGNQSDSRSQYQKNINLEVKQADERVEGSKNMMSVNIRSKQCKQNNKILENEQDPWDMMEIIQ